jgi:hypothetical protein
MAFNNPNRLVYVFPAVAFAAVLLYYLYGAIDRFGLETHQTEARVTGKQFAPGSTTYNTRIAGGRAWSQATENPGGYVMAFEVDGEPTGGAVDSQTYESVQEGDHVHVRFQRTRFSKLIVVTDVRR